MAENIQHPWLSLRLETERLILRPVQAGDTAAVFAMGSDPEVTRYGSELPWTDAAQADARIVRSINAVTCGEYLPLVMERREDGAVIGECGLYQWSLQNRRAELGYRMNSAFWGKAYMREALTALLDWAFSREGLHRIEADTDPGNVRSIHLLNMLGFTQEGLLRERWIVGDQIFDTAMFGLLARDWTETRRNHASAKSLPGKTGETDRSAEHRTGGGQ